MSDGHPRGGVGRKSRGSGDRKPPGSARALKRPRLISAGRAEFKEIKDSEEIAMPRGGARPGAGRPKKDPSTKVPKGKKPDKKGFTAPDGSKSKDAPPSWPFGTEPPIEGAQTDPEDGLTDDQRANLSPLEYLLAVMRSPEAAASARMQAAIQAAPYVHGKQAPVSKKDAGKSAASDGSGRFNRRQPPRLVAAGGKKV